MKLEVLRGDDAHRALEDRGFQLNWSTLHQRCAWSTVFQNVGFVTAWYRSYREVYEPIIVAGVEGNGSLSGLFLLARERQTGALVHAGAQHAEYQTWIARPDRSGFISDALDALKPVAGGATLQLRYVPSILPLEPLTSSPNWGWRTVDWLQERGMADLSTPDGISTLVESSRYRYRMRRIASLGPVNFRVVTTRQELEPWLEQLIAFCDVRMGAINGAFPFYGDPYKREFHLAMLDAPNVLHTTLLTAGNNLISAQINFLDRRTISLGLISHSPMQGKISPGTLHLLLLARQAAAEGFETIDLTPGGEYKERFASFADPTRVVSIQFAATQAVRAQVRRFAAEQAKTRIREMGLKPAAVKKEWLARIERVRSIVGRPATANGGRQRETRDAVSIFRVPTPFQNAATTETPRPRLVDLRIDEVGDLLLPSPSGESPLTRRAELRAALARFERGGQLITRVEDGRVTNLAWLTRGPGKAHLGPEFADYELSENTMLIHDAITSAEAERFVEDVMAYARDRGPKHELFLAARPTDRIVRGASAIGAEIVATVAPQIRTETSAEQGSAEGAIEQASSS